MRISAHEAEQAVAIIASQFGQNAAIWLFGSRVDDQQRGGDVDLFVETDTVDALARLRCRSQLTELFDLHVDLVVGKGDDPIHRIAKTTGIRLK